MKEWVNFPYGSFNEARRYFAGYCTQLFPVGETWDRSSVKKQHEADAEHSPPTSTEIYERS